ncbi:MAG: glycosyltransferase family 39 protein [Anaerolineae bacterium]|nr:glycosyltransferase family 39 protein [Anaerolineae bacterium]
MNRTWRYSAILLLAFVVRVIGIDFGQATSIPQRTDGPPLYEQAAIHPDEYFYVAIPLQMLLKGSLNPGFYENPSLLIYLDYATFALTGADDNIRSWNWRDWNIRELAPFHLYVIGRLYSALGGIIAVATTIALAHRLKGSRAGELAGLLLALAPSLVQHGHYATTSSLAAGFVALCLWACITALMTRRKTAFFVLAGIAAGLATGSRYNAAAVSIAVFVTGILLLWHGRDRKTVLTVLAGYIAFPVTFLLTTPGVLADFGAFWEQFTFIYNHFSFDENVALFGGLLYEYRYIVLFGIGIPGAFAAVIGLLTLRNWRVILVMLAFLLPYSFVVLDTPIPQTGDQLTLLVLPPLAVLAGIGANWLMDRLRWRFRAAIIAVGLLTMPAVLTATIVLLFAEPDTRQLAQEWVQANVPSGTRIHLAGGYNVPLDDARYDLSQSFGEPGNAEALAEQGVDVVIISEASLFYAQRRDNFSQSAKDVFAAEWAAYAAYPLLAEWQQPRWWGYDLMVNNMSYWHHPTIRIVCLAADGCPDIRQNGAQTSD